MATNFSIQTNPVDADPLRSYNFNVLITPPIGIAASSSYHDPLILRARSVTVPGRSNEPIEIPYGAMSSFFVGKPKFSTNQCSIVFQEYTDRTVSKFLYAWQELQFTVADGSANAVDKKGIVSPSFEIQLFDFAGINIPTADNGRVSLVNAWVQNVEDVQLDWNTSDGVTITATFQFDYWAYASGGN